MKKVEYQTAIFFPASFYYTRQEFRHDLDPYPEHNHDFYEFFLVVSGRVLHRFNGRNVILTPGMIQLIRPEDTHQVLLSENAAEAVIYNCNIKKDEFIPLFSFLTGSDRCSVDDLVQTVDLAASPEFAGLTRRIEKILELQCNANVPDFFRSALSRSIQQEVICFFLERTVKDELQEPEWLQMVFSEMRKPDNFMAGLSRMQTLSGRSREHLSRMFRQCYGMTPREYLLELRLRRVTELLAHSNLSVLDAACRAGFNNLAYFRKCFRARYGITPKHYRNRCKDV